jgi:cyclophilin family peptidyl-prolyl cis-trans isomerase
METIVVIETSLGSFKIALDEAKAPRSVANFLQYVDDKHYDGTIFHRVIDGFMAQGGGYDGAYEKKPVRDPVENEAHNGVKTCAARWRWREPASRTRRRPSSS